MMETTVPSEHQRLGRQAKVRSVVTSMGSMLEDDVLIEAALVGRDSIGRSGMNVGATIGRLGCIRC